MPDFTGRENVYLNGAILGMWRQEIDQKFDEIVDFAEMAEFIDTPVKRYSSGMQVKLAFAVATSIESEILIVDEVLAVGDLAFQRKCFDRMEDLIRKPGGRFLIVSHNIRQLERICSRMLLLDKGKVMMDGEPAKISNTYYDMTTSKVFRQQSSAGKHKDQITGYGSSGEIEVQQILFFSGDNRTPVTDVEMASSWRVGIRFAVTAALKSVEIVIGVHTTDFVFVTKSSTAMTGQILDFEPGEHYFECALQSLPLAPGSYAIGMAFYGKKRRPIWYGDNLQTFQVVANNVDMTKIPPAALVYLPLNGIASIKCGGGSHCVSS